MTQRERGDSCASRTVRAKRPARCSRVAALAALFLAAASGRAAAQEAIWIASPVEQLESWYPEVRAALESEGVLVSEARAESQRCAAQRARDAARARGALRGLCVDVEVESTRAIAVTVEVAAVGGPAVKGRAQGAREDPAAATRAAYRRAELALELGDEGLVRVQTTPEGAVVAFDGKPGGHAPLERRLAPGAHRIELELDGFAPQRRQVQVAAGRVVELDVRLERSAPGPSEVRITRSPLNYIVGGALLAAAAPLLAISLVALARDGDCAQERGGACVERVHFGGRSAVLLGAGAAALGAGTYLLLAAPIEVEVQADTTGAGVMLGTRFF